MALTVTGITPASGSSISGDTFVNFTVSNTTAFTLASLVIVAEFTALQGLREVIYAGLPGTTGAFSNRFPNSTLVVTGGTTTTYAFSVRSLGTWPTNFKLLVFASNAVTETLVGQQAFWNVTVGLQLPVQPIPPMPAMFGSGYSISAVWFDQTHFLETLANSYPEDYLGSIQATPDGGYEVFQSAAKLMERVSIAVSRFEDSMFFGSAQGGSYATGSVEFYRSANTDGAINILPGTLVKTNKGNRLFKLTSSVSFDGTELGPKVAQIQAVDYGYQYNVPGQVLTAANEVLEGEISKIVTLNTSPVTIDRFMSVRQLAPTVGGAPASLDGLGNDVNVRRLSGESDAAYRMRILDVPDTVSPDAVKRGVNKVLNVLDTAACLREVGSPLFRGFFYDAGSSADAVQNPDNNYAWDMDTVARPQDRFKTLLDLVEMRGFFLVGLPPAGSTFGAAYDTSTSATFPLANAYDTTAGNAKGACYDGYVYAQDPNVYKNVWQVIEAKRAAGVRFDVYPEDIGCF